MKKTNFITKIFFLAPLLFTLNASLAEGLNKHPRVAELEDKLRADAGSYLRSRFPDQPFLVNASVDPVHRRVSNDGKPESESLPYFDSSEQELNDEWDDPNASLNQLLLRTKKVVMEVALPDNLTDGEQAEVKDALYRSLHLIPARDEISIERRKWSNAKTINYVVVFTSIAIVFFLIGLAIVQRIGFKKLASSIGAVQFHSNAQPATSTPTTPLVQNHPAKSISGDVNISDPLKTRELMESYLIQAKELKVFPTLEVMILFDQYSHHQPAAFGSLLSELGFEMREQILRQGPDSRWYECIINGGALTRDSIDLFHEAIKYSQYAHSAELENALIAVWRLEKQAPDFVRTLDKKTAISLLKRFPKNLSIRIARQAFPGNWAEVLETSQNDTPISDKTCHEICERAYAIKAHLTFEKVAEHRQYLQLIEFLANSNPEVEKEVYLAMGAESYLAKNRSPFYSVLESTPEVLSEVAKRFTPQQWAVALFNVSRADRKKIEEFMQDKQKILFIEHLKNLDQNNPNAKEIAHYRTLIVDCMNDTSSVARDVDHGVTAENEEAPRAA